jgi:hypothetical protein
MLPLYTASLTIVYLVKQIFFALRLFANEGDLLPTTRALDLAFLLPLAFGIVEGHAAAGLRTLAHHHLYLFTSNYNTS